MYLRDRSLSLSLHRLKTGSHRRVLFKILKKKHQNTWTSNVPSTYFCCCYINLSEDETGFLCFKVVSFKYDSHLPNDQLWHHRQRDFRHQHCRKGSYGQKKNSWSKAMMISFQWRQKSRKVLREEVMQSHWWYKAAICVTYTPYGY